MFKPTLNQEEIKKRQELYLSLPQHLRQIIASEETADKLYNISWGKNQLKSDGQTIVSFTVGETLLGIINLSDFASILAKRLEIDQAKAEKIYQEINLEIFRPIMAYLPKQSQPIGPKPTPPPNIPTQKPQPAAENIVDLKNIFKE